MKALTNLEIENTKLLTNMGAKFSLLESTPTILKKGYFDAIKPFREFLINGGIHDYESQGRGQEHKVLKTSRLIADNAFIESRTSFYRPNAKPNKANGDPRIWFSQLPKIMNPYEKIAIIEHDCVLYVVNISRVDLNSFLERTEGSPLKDLITEITDINAVVVKELLGKLRELAKDWIPSEVQADTGIGRTLESCLGIKMNGSKAPDYKGIELKSNRDNKGNRKTLFTQVPNWSISKFKSSREIFDKFSYISQVDGKRGLRCTMSALKPNSQGLYLKVEAEKGYLHEMSDKYGKVCIWELDDLHARLLEKHKQTFWISAENRVENGIEYFKYKEVEFTRNPNIAQFDTLLEQGMITVDHLMSLRDNGQLKESPSFKIKPNSLDLLIPNSIHYNLQE